MFTAAVDRQLRSLAAQHRQDWEAVHAAMGQVGYSAAILRERHEWLEAGGEQAPGDTPPELPSPRVAPGDPEPSGHSIFGGNTLAVQMERVRSWGTSSNGRALA